MSREFTNEQRKYFNTLQTSTNSDELSLASVSLVLAGYVEEVVDVLRTRLLEIDEEATNDFYRSVESLFIQPVRYDYFPFEVNDENHVGCLLYTSPSPRDQRGSRMPSSA